MKNSKHLLKLGDEPRNDRWAEPMKSNSAIGSIRRDHNRRLAATTFNPLLPPQSLDHRPMPPGCRHVSEILTGLFAAPEGWPAILSEPARLPETRKETAHESH